MISGLGREIVLFSASDTFYQAWMIYFRCRNLERDLDCVYTIPAHFGNGENVAVAKFEPDFAQSCSNLKTIKFNGN